MTKATIITDEPIIEVISSMQLHEAGVLNMAKWIERYRPKCVPEGGFNKITDLLPHDGLRADGTKVTDNELLAELAGRKCYDSFAEQGAPRSNEEYLNSMWKGRVPHRSTGYHPHMTFFIAHVSRRVSHELIRNYVGHAKDEEGAPSQESTRFTHHPGTYIAHPRDLEDLTELAMFEERATANYRDYVNTIQRKETRFFQRTGASPKGLDKKRIYESCAGDLLMSCGTSFIWTTNPMALAKFFFERDDEAADLEMCRFARKWKKICNEWWPGLFSFTKGA